MMVTNIITPTLRASSIGSQARPFAAPWSGFQADLSSITCHHTSSEGVMLSQSKDGGTVVGIFRLKITDCSLSMNGISVCQAFELLVHRLVCGCRDIRVV